MSFDRLRTVTAALTLGLLASAVVATGCLAEEPRPSRLELDVVNGDTTQRTVELTVSNESAEKIASRRFTVAPDGTANASLRLSPGQYTVNVSSDSGVYFPRKVDLESGCTLTLIVAVNDGSLDTTKSDCLGTD